MERKKKNEHIYTLRLTKRQAELLSWTCDQFSRIIIGQDWTYQEMFEQGWEKRCKEATGRMMDEEWDGGWQAMRNEAEELSQHIKKRFFGLDRCTLNGVGYDDSADILFDLYQVIRKQLWDDRPDDQKSFMTVDSDKAMQFGSEPLARIERNDDGNYKRPVLVCYCAKCGKPYYASALNRHGDGLSIWDLEDTIDAAVSDSDRMEIYYGKENPLKDICKCGKG